MYRKHWKLKRESSSFVDWQRVKVQELSDEVCNSAAMSTRPNVHEQVSLWAADS